MHLFSIRYKILCKLISVTTEKRLLHDRVVFIVYKKPSEKRDQSLFNFNNSRELLLWPFNLLCLDMTYASITFIVGDIRVTKWNKEKK